MRVQRVLWFILVLIAIVWGFVTGVAFAKDVWLQPTTGVFGTLAVLVLAATVYTMGSQKR